MNMPFLTRFLALLVSTALIGGPTLSQEIFPGHTGSPPPPETRAAIANSIAASEKPDPLPAGTPTDDYEFMGWCTGILTGHMELYTKVKPQLDVISRRWSSADEDAKQQAAQQTEGHALIARFRKVMAAVEAAKPGLGVAGQAAFQKGMAGWAAVYKIDKQQQAYAWMNFGFPVQCETRVTALEKNPITLSDRAAAKPVATIAKPAAKGRPKAKTESESKATALGLQP